MAAGAGKGKRGGEEQGSAILECAGRDAAAHVIPEGLGHRGEHPAKSGSHDTSEQAPTGEACQIGCTTPMQAQPRCCGKGPTKTKKFLYNPVMSFAFPYTPSSRFR